MKNKLSVNLEVTLIEIILSLLIFAVAGAIMINCFFIARFTQLKANDKVIAGNIVQSNIEIIKSFNSLNETEKFVNDNFQIIKNEANVNTYINFYDKGWELSETDNEYFITLIISKNVTENGTVNDIELKAERFKPYPFINKNNNNQKIYIIETKKFFPNH